MRRCVPETIDIDTHERSLAQVTDDPLFNDLADDDTLLTVETSRWFV